MRPAFVLLAVGCWMSVVSGQSLERTISLRDTFGWLRGEQSFAYDSRRQLAYVCADYDSMLFVLDGTTNAKKARVPVPFGISGIVYDSLDDRLLCVRGEADRVVVLDCGTLSVVTSIPVGNEPVSICYADRANRAYTVNEGDSTISVLDCARMVELARLPIQLDVSEPLYNRVTNTLWFSLVEGESLYVVDCVGDSFVARIDAGWKVWGLDCDQMTGTMYCIDAGRDVVVVDGAGFQVRERIAADDEIWALACAWRDGRLYLLEDCGIAVYDYRARELLDTLIPYDSEDDPDLIRYSPQADVVWFAWGGCTFGPGHVGVLDCVTGDMFLGPGVYYPRKLLAAPNGQTYLCSTNEPMLILKDAREMFTGVVTDVYRPYQVTCNSMDGTVYASGASPTVVIVDPLLDIFFIHPGISYLSSACLNSTENLLYGFHGMEHAVCTDLVVLDGAGRRVAGRIKTGNDPSTFCVNSTADKVYCGSWGGRDLRVYDGHSDSMLARFDLGLSVSALGLALIENKLYCGGNADAVTVIDCGGDSVMGKLYIPRVESEFCYSPAARRIYYLTDYGRELEAIDCRTDTVVSSIRLPGSGRSLCLNSRENKLCVTLPDSGRVAVISCGADTLAAEIAVGSAQQYGYMEACYDAQGDKLYCPVDADNSVA